MTAPQHRPQWIPSRKAHLRFRWGDVQAWDTKNLWKPAVTADGLPHELRMHDLRHTAATLLISKGAHPQAIKRHLGHSSIKMTMDIYGHLFPSEADELAAALDDLYRQFQTDKP